MPQQPPIVKLLEGLVALALSLSLYLKDLGRQQKGGRNTVTQLTRRDEWTDTDHLSQD